MASPDTRVPDEPDERRAAEQLGQVLDALDSGALPSTLRERNYLRGARDALAAAGDQPTGEPEP